MSAPPALSNEECREIAKRHLKSEGFELKSFEVSPLSAEMKGFMGDHLKLRISVTQVKKDSQKAERTDLQFFVKSVPLEDAYRRSFIMSTVAYQKEVLFYSDLLTGVRKHLRCAEEESSNYLGTVPQCYYLRPDLLVLEDLTLLGFRTLDSREPLSMAQSECVLRALARLHATSLVFEAREGQRLADKYPLLLEETIFRKEPGFPLYDAERSCLRMAHVLLDLVPRFATRKPRNEALHRVLDSTMEEIYQLLKPSDKYRLALCHRDLWVNNMLFAEDAKGELSVRLVDFQSLHLEPPAHDVTIFLHLAMLRKPRQAHWRRLLELYHQALAGVLDQHDLDVDSVLPLEIFLQSCEEAKPVAAVLAAYILQITMLPLKKDTNLESFFYDREDMMKAAYQNDERFRARITETMEELVETCLIPRLADEQQ